MLENQPETVVQRPSHEDGGDNLDRRTERGRTSGRDTSPRRPADVEQPGGVNLEYEAWASAAEEKSASRPGTVLVGIDGSPEARAALRWAVQQARHTGAPVHAVAVWHEPPQFGEAPIPIDDSDVEQEAVGWLQAALADLPDTDVTTSVERGDPTRALLDHAADAELLVLGNHGRGAVAGAVLGSVAQRCAHHAHCPVVLVPAPS